MTFGGFLPWLIVVLGGAIVLGIAIAYGMRRNAERTPAEKAMTNAATRAQYKSENN